MKVRLIHRSNPMDRNQSPKYYALMNNEGVATLYDLAQQITKYSSLSQGDVLNVLENMIDAASLYLATGRAVQVGRLGMFRIVLKSDGVDAPGDFSCKLIHRIKLRFIPNVQFKKQLEDISFEVIK